MQRQGKIVAGVRKLVVVAIRYLELEERHSGPHGPSLLLLLGLQLSGAFVQNLVQRVAREEEEGVLEGDERMLPFSLIYDALTFEHSLDLGDVLLVQVLWIPLI